MEGMSPPWLQACICWKMWSLGWLGSKPGFGTQRFLPRGYLYSPRSYGVRCLPLRLFSDLRRGDQSVRASSLRAPEASGALSVPFPAGAAHGTGNFETLSTLSPPFRNHQQCL